MGLLLNLGLAHAAARRNQRGVKHCMLASVDHRMNTILCGGAKGSAAEDRGLTFLEQQIGTIRDGGYPAVVLSADREWMEQLYGMYGSQFSFFGINACYEPFKSCRSCNDASMVMEWIIDAYTDLPGVRTDTSRLNGFCTILLRILSLRGTEYLSYYNFEILAELVMHADGVRGFAALAAEQGIHIPPALQQTLEVEWTQNMAYFHDFWIRLSRSMQEMRPAALVDSPASAYCLEEVLANNRVGVFCLNCADSTLAAAAIYAETMLACMHRIPFCFVDYNIPIPEKAAKTLFSPVGQDDISFGMYFTTFRNMQVPLESVMPTLDYFVCLGLRSMMDAEEILRSFTGERRAWIPHFDIGGRQGGFGVGMGALPSVYPDQLMEGRSRDRVRDGGACILSPAEIIFCDVLRIG